MKPFEGKVVVVTGAARGIGAAVARALIERGARVMLADLDGKGATATAVALDRVHGKGSAIAMATDVGDPQQVEALFSTVKREMGRLDILVNSAGVARVSHFLDHSLDDWELVLRINLTGTFLCGQAAARLMMKNKPASRSEGKPRGAIVNIASISGQRGGTGRAAYGASKGGVIALTKVMAVDLAGYGIRVNAIAPGPIETEMAAKGHTKATRAAYHALVPQARYGGVDDIAHAAAFLAGGESGYITGHTLNVDGGFGAAGLMFGDLTREA
jgi:NAD(P)-dependent dehydrogenase (short-subunit alcohol dehydrogenase family)